jgi:hypothetical protein
MLPYNWEKVEVLLSEHIATNVSSLRKLTKSSPVPPPKFADTAPIFL